MENSDISPLPSSPLTPQLSATTINDIVQPRSIAIVGASTNPAKQGYRYVQTLKEFGFKGAIYPVNPRAKEISGLKCYPSLKDVPRPLDYVISAVPASSIPKLMEETAGMNIKAIHCYTGRMAEMGTKAGIELQRKLVNIASKYGIRIIGPNCMGLYNPGAGISFRLNFPKISGPVGFLSQSGGNAVEFIQRSSLRGIFFSKAISYGNASDLNESDFLDYLSDDPKTLVIACYIEGIKDGTRFKQSLSSAARKKPVVILKGGRSKAGSRAIASHTASLAGSTQVWKAMATQAGAIWADSMDEMVDLVVGLSYFDPPSNTNVGIVCGGGGNTVHSADICEAAGLNIAPLPQNIRNKFKSHLPDTWFATNNPFDFSGIMSSDDGGLTMPLAVKLMAESKSFDIVLFDPDIEFNLEHKGASSRMVEVFNRLIKLRKSTQTPIVVIIKPGDGMEEWRWRTTTNLQKMAWEAGIAVYPSMARAAASIVKIIRHHQNK